MGKIMQGIFGGSRSKQKSQQQSQSTSQNLSSSWNDAYPFIKDKFSGSVDTGLRSQDFIARLLGLGGNAQADEAFDRYKDSAGYDFIMDSGVRAVDSSAASKGALNSGATLKALQDRGQATGSQFFNAYLDRLLGLSGQGLAGAGLIAQTGQKSFGQGTSQASSYGTSSGSSSTKPGIAQFLGQIASGIAASERRIKEGLTRLGVMKSGLPFYSFRYKGENDQQIGVLADEVEKIMPEALGPVIDGVQTVDYDKIPGWPKTQIPEGVRE